MLFRSEVVPARSVIVNENSFEDYMSDKPVVFFGDGAAKCKALFQKFSNTFYLDVMLSSVGMVRLAEEAFHKQLFENVSLFEPFYLKEAFIGKASG